MLKTPAYPKWSELLQEGRFNEQFLRKYLDGILFYAGPTLCRYQKLSPELIREIWNQVDPSPLCYYQTDVPLDLIRDHYHDLEPGYREMFWEEFTAYNPELSTKYVNSIV